jgi:hypothetical protein
MLASEPDSSELSPNHLIAWRFSPKTEEPCSVRIYDYFSLFFQGSRIRIAPHTISLGLGRTLSERRLRRLPFSILFKMPITTTKLSKNENAPAMDEATASP